MFWKRVKIWKNNAYKNCWNPFQEFEFDNTKKKTQIERHFHDINNEPIDFSIFLVLCVNNVVETMLMICLRLDANDVNRVCLFVSIDWRRSIDWFLSEWKVLEIESIATFALNYKRIECTYMRKAFTQ